MQVVEAVLIDNCLAQKRVNGKVEKKPIKKGTKVRGQVTKIALSPDSEVLALKTKEGFVIPEPFLEVIGLVEEEEIFDDAEIIEDEENGKEDKTKVFKDAYKNIIASDIVAEKSLKSRRATYFALGGALAGLIYAMMKRQNKLVFASIGAFGGGFLGSVISNKLKDEKSK